MLCKHINPVIETCNHSQTISRSESHFEEAPSTRTFNCPVLWVYALSLLLLMCYPNGQVSSYYTQRNICSVHICVRTITMALCYATCKWHSSDHAVNTSALLQQHSTYMHTWQLVWQVHKDCTVLFWMGKIPV